jgi:hypothetical protein
LDSRTIVLQWNFTKKYFRYSFNLFWQSLIKIWIFTFWNLQICLRWWFNQAVLKSLKFQFCFMTQTVYVYLLARTRCIFIWTRLCYSDVNVHQFNSWIGPNVLSKQNNLFLPLIWCHHDPEKHWKHLFQKQITNNGSSQTMKIFFDKN